MPSFTASLARAAMCFLMVAVGALLAQVIVPSCMVGQLGVEGRESYEIQAALTWRNMCAPYLVIDEHHHL